MAVASNAVASACDAATGTAAAAEARHGAERRATKAPAMNRRRRLDAEQRAEIDLYSLDQLRTLYHETKGGDDAPVKLRKMPSDATSLQPRSANAFAEKTAMFCFSHGWRR
jgi:hypothetical protein